MFLKNELDFFAHENKKKTPQKVAYLSRISTFQKFSLTAQQPKWQNSCSQLWSIEQLYIELGIFWEGDSKTQNILKKINK